jgi:hypothetical protein
MIRYVFEIIEIRTYTSHYTVDAENEEEARTKASIGDTFNEEEIQFEEVIARAVGNCIKVSEIPSE